MKKVAVIIPHRDRHEHLAHCLWAIGGCMAWDTRGCFWPHIFVVDDGGLPPYIQDYLWATLLRESWSPIFNKCRLQNIGIKEGCRRSADVFVFLDADAIVGPGWLKSLELLDDPAITKVCYRVRLVDLPVPNDAFDHYDDYPLCLEGRGKPEHLVRDPDSTEEPLFGNSHFAIRAETLGDLRFNEDFEGAGFEDLWMNREIYRRHHETYRGVMPADPKQNILSIAHQRDKEGWRTRDILARNRNRYLKT